MKCPKCGKEGCKYFDKIVRREIRDKKNNLIETIRVRENYKARCNKCKFEGIL